jgi:glycerate kinase
MKILLAPDSFKGSLSASAFCDIAGASIRALDPGIEVIGMPMSDGGEGLAEILWLARGGRQCRATVTDPLGRPITANYTVLADRTTAVIDFASASGLTRVEPELRNPLVASSRGTGELMLAAMEGGCDRLLVGLGGSASNDGGTGALSALGFRFLDRHGRTLENGGADLQRLHTIDLSGVSSLLGDTRIELICDVTAPLLGAEGASTVYSPQKGADAAAVQQLEAGLGHLQKVMEDQFESAMGLALTPGSGAAGGAGFGLASLLGANIHNGFDFLATELGLHERLADESPDLVITGEGCLDRQTLQGKVVQGVAESCANAGIRCVAVAGQVKAGAEALRSLGLSRTVALVSDQVSVAQAIQRVEALLGEAVRAMVLEFSMSPKTQNEIDIKKS